MTVAKGMCFERQSSRDQYAMSLLQTGRLICLLCAHTEFYFEMRLANSDI